MYLLRFIVLFFCIITTVFAQNKTAAPEELMVLLNPNVDVETFWNSTKEFSSLIHYKKALSKSLNIHLIAVADSEKLAFVQQKLEQISLVQFVQKNSPITWRKSPNDPSYSTQTALNIIQVEQAWEYTTGGLSHNGDTIVCAVVDGSFDVQHEDLIDNIWHNYAEIPNNQIDDDQNGFVDDFTGWQTVFNTDQHNYGNISNHGTSVLGIIGAKGDNSIGVAGINWDIKLLLLSAHSPSEITKISNIIEAYSYIVDMRRKYNQTNGQKGAFVVTTNSSWGIDFAWAVDNPIWCALYDSLGAVGILSVAATTNTNNDIDRYGDMPCTCKSDYLIGVSESSLEDKQVAGYGEESIELFAPAETRSTRWASNYGLFSGTSGAAPHVAGAISLMYSYPSVGLSALVQQNPQKAALLIKSILLNSVDKKATFDQSVSGGRLNLGRAMKQLAEHFSSPKNGELLLVYPSPASNLLTIKAALANEGKHLIKVYNYLGQPVAVWTLQNTAPTIGYWHFEVGHLANGVYILELETDNKKFIQRFVKG